MSTSTETGPSDPTGGTMSPDGSGIPASHVGGVQATNGAPVLHANDTTDNPDGSGIPASHVETVVHPHGSGIPASHVETGVHPHGSGIPASHVEQD